MGAARQVEPLTARRRILVVDDNLDNVRSLAMLFQQMGHIVDYAINATVAVDLATRLGPDIVFLDLLLPDDHGAGVCAELRKNPQLAKTPIIGITGSDRMFDLQLALDAGCDDVLRKPVPLRVYERLLAGGASRRKLRDMTAWKQGDARPDGRRLAESDRLVREMERLTLRAQTLLHEHRHTVAALKEVQDKLDATLPISPDALPPKKNGKAG